MAGTCSRLLIPSWLRPERARPQPGNQMTYQAADLPGRTGQPADEGPSLGTPGVPRPQFSVEGHLHGLSLLYQPRTTGLFAAYEPGETAGGGGLVDMRGHDGATDLVHVDRIEQGACILANEPVSQLEQLIADA